MILQDGEVLIIRRPAYSVFVETRIDKIFFMFWGPRFFPRKMYEFPNTPEILSELVDGFNRKEQKQCLEA